MRKTVHSKLIACYILIGIIGFLFATAGGSHFVESYLEGEVVSEGRNDEKTKQAKKQITT